METFSLSCRLMLDYHIYYDCSMIISVLFVVYTPIEENSTWKFTTGTVPSNWKDVVFDVSQWQDVNLANPTLTPSGTQYFRKTFTGLSGLAAYELSLKYTAGIVAYINNNEVYRDNMPAGEISSSTAATGSYSTLAYHSVIRNAIEVASSTSVLAVEVHSTASTPATSIELNVWMMIYASTKPTSSNSEIPCYAYPYDVDITAVVGTNPSYAMDFNKGSYWGVSPYSGTPSILYTLPIPAFVNAVSIFPEANPSYAPRTFTIQRSEENSGDEFEMMISGTSQVYEQSVGKTFSTPFVSGLSRRVQMTVSGR